MPLKDYANKVFYVWFDAPIGYISATKEWARTKGRPEYWRKFWIGGEAKIYNFLGKDNIPFHTIFWPGMLFAHGGLNLPYDVVGLQFCNYEGEKISKSRNWGVFCESVPEAGLDADIWRYYRRAGGRHRQRIGSSGGFDSPGDRVHRHRGSGHAIRIREEDEVLRRGVIEAA